MTDVLVRVEGPGREPTRLNDDAPDPWTEYRKRYPLVPTMRVINVANGTDEFRVLQALKDFGELVLDGATLIEGRQDTDEPAHVVIARFDQRWRERRAARLKDPARRR